MKVKMSNRDNKKRAELDLSSLKNYKTSRSFYRKSKQIYNKLRMGLINSIENSVFINNATLIPSCSSVILSKYYFN